MKEIIKKILKFFGWKLIKIQSNKKTPNNFAFPKPEIHDFEIILKSSGVLHLGGHRGTESGIYNWFNKKVLWIEAIPEIFSELEINIKYHFGQKAICALLGNEDNKKTKFYLSNNDKASSSIFDLSSDVKDKKLWIDQNIKMDKYIFLQMRTLDSIFNEHNINSSEYNHWVVDLQGSELIFLKGADNAIKNCKSISIEISKKEFYDGGAKWEEVKNYLILKGFILFKEPKIDHTEVLFLKK